MPNPFKPPDAPVADVGPPRDTTRAAAALLLTAMALESWWVVVTLRKFLALSDLGVLGPAGLLCWVVGLTALYAGIGRLFLAGRGMRLLMAAIVLLLLSLYMWGARLVFFMGSQARFHGWPILFALMIAFGAWLLARAKERMRRSTSMTEAAS